MASDITYWKDGVKSAMMDSRRVSRWDLGFKRSILENAQRVLGDNVKTFIPDICFLYSVLTDKENEEINDFLETLDDEEFY